MENNSTTDLLQLLKAGNKATFDRLFRIFYIKLRNYSFRITNNISASEDIVQDLFFNLWTKPELTEKIVSLEAYLRTSVYNRSVGYLKEKNKWGNMQPVNQFIDLEGLHIEIIQYHRDVLNEKELALAIGNAIEQLPEQCRLVFKLSRNFGLKNMEIANHLGITIKGVEKHITKALLHLRTELKDYLTILLLIFLP